MITFKIKSPRLGSCDRGMRFKGMSTFFECQREANHLLGQHSFEDRDEGFTIYWDDNEDNDTLDHPDVDSLLDNDHTGAGWVISDEFFGTSNKSKE